MYARYERTIQYILHLYGVPVPRNGGQTPPPRATVYMYAIVRSDFAAADTCCGALTRTILNNIIRFYASACTRTYYVFIQRDRRPENVCLILQIPSSRVSSARDKSFSSRSSRPPARHSARLILSPDTRGRCIRRSVRAEVPGRMSLRPYLRTITF